MSTETVLEVNVPLLLRLLEYAREDANNDLDLHFLTENLVKHSTPGTALTMKDYPQLVEGIHGKV